jgi:deoxyribodipyrimidine photo-lyase
LKKFVSLGDVDEAIRLLESYKEEHDPEGVFMRRWLPELEAVPLVHLHEPWAMPPFTQMRLGWTLGVDYPRPIVDYAAAARQARDRLWARRRQPGFREQSDASVERHGSRRAAPGARTAR